jgi:hypothetical protein
MGKQRVDITEKDIIFFKFLYKHRYVNLRTVNILYANKPDTLYRKLKKLTEYCYIKTLRQKNMEPVFALDKEGYNTLIKINPDKEHKKINITEQRIALNSNANHHLIIAEIGAMLTNRNIDYEIDLNIKKMFPEWALIPDIILINNKIGFEVELENKSMIRYAKKLSQLQMTESIKKLIYLSRGNSLTYKIDKIEEYKAGKTLDERIILDETKNKIEFININEFILDIDRFLGHKTDD